MKKLISGTMALALLATTLIPSAALAQHRGPPPRGPHGFPPPPQRIVHMDHHGHRSGWYVAGGLLTGLAIGSILQNVCAEPPRREVVYTTRYVETPTVIREVQYVQPSAVVPETTVTIWVRNSNGSQTPVTLRRAAGDRYIGPRGEYYDGLPGNESLRALYGM